MLELDPESPLLLPLDGRAAHAEAIDTLLSWAQRSIGIFDNDLSEPGWSSPLRAELLTRFFQRSPQARLEIFLREPGRFHTALPRLAALWRLRTHALSIHQVGEDALGLFDPFLIVDQRHYWHRFHFEQARGEIGVCQPEYANQLLRRLQEIREVSGPATAVTVLGL